MCVYLGLEPQGEYENPFDSKRGYVRARLLTKSMDELAELARKVVAQFGDEDLAMVLERLGAHGVAGDYKNLTFAADGRSHASCFGRDQQRDRDRRER